MGTLSAPVEGFDLSLRLTSRTIGTPIAAVLGAGAGESEAVRAYEAGARLIELDSVDGALRASIALDLLRASGAVPEEDSFAATFLAVRLPASRTAADAILDGVGSSLDARFAIAESLTPEQANALGASRPLTAVTLPSSLDAESEAFAKTILQEWGDDLVLALEASAAPAAIAPALDRLRAAAESAGCTLVIRVPASAPAALLAAISGSAAEGMPVWMHGVEAVAFPAAFGRGASLASTADPKHTGAAFAALAEPAVRSSVRRVSDLVLFGPAPDDAIRAAAEAQFGKESWLVAPVKNSVLALMKLTELRGAAKLESALTVESLAHPPKECCLYKDEVPDLKEAATGWFYDRWVRETMRRRLVAG